MSPRWHPQSDGLSFGSGAVLPVAPGLVSHLPAERALRLGIRPEAVVLSESGAAGLLESRISNIEPLGSHEIVDVVLGSTTLRARTEPGRLRTGAPVWVGIDTERAHFFDADSGMALRRIA